MLQHQNNEVRVVIEQLENGVPISSRTAVSYPGLANGIANQLNLMLSAAVDQGITPVIDLLKDQKAAANGQAELVAALQPLVDAVRGGQVK